jgi:hypothetical protein
LYRVPLVCKARRQCVDIATSAGDREMKAFLAAHRSVTIGNPDTACVSGDRSYVTVVT